jgi:hypothetical protein
MNTTILWAVFNAIYVWVWIIYIFVTFIMKVPKLSLQACSCLCVHLCACTLTTWILLNRFAWNLIMGNFTKICQHNPSLVRTGQQYWTLYIKTYMYVMSLLSITCEIFMGVENV